MTTAEKINQIATELDSGNRAFVHKETGEWVFMPEFDHPDFQDEVRGKKLPPRR